jgi:hypothetical protein
VRYSLLTTVGALWLATCSWSQQPSTSHSGTALPDPGQASAAAAGATDSQAPQTKPEAQEQIEKEKQIGKEREIEKEEQSQRMLGVVPMFSVTNRHDAPPLSSHAKFHLMTKSLTDPFIFVAVGLQAASGQANDSFHGYGQGAQGYAKRYAANLADSADSNFWSNYAYPVLFKQDPRYFRMAEGGVRKRIWYAVTQEFIAHQDSGGRNFHWSNILGAFTAGTISNVYYPKSDRGVGLTASRAGIALLYGGLGNLALEFWPDIAVRLDKKHRAQPQPSVELPPKP